MTISSVSKYVLKYKTLGSYIFIRNIVLEMMYSLNNEFILSVEIGAHDYKWNHGIWWDILRAATSFGKGLIASLNTFLIKGIKKTVADSYMFGT